MTTIKLILPGGAIGDEIKPMQLKPDTLVSYYEYFKGVSGNKGSLIRDWHKTATGTAKNDGYVRESGYGYEIRVVGQWKDVQVVVERLQDALGATDITPRPRYFGLPDLTDTFSRIKWLYRWMRYGLK